MRHTHLAARASFSINQRLNARKESKSDEANEIQCETENSFQAQIWTLLKDDWPWTFEFNSFRLYHIIKIIPRETNKRQYFELLLVVEDLIAQYLNQCISGLNGDRNPITEILIQSWAGWQIHSTLIWIHCKISQFIAHWNWYSSISIYIRRLI